MRISLQSHTSATTLRILTLIYVRVVIETYLGAMQYVKTRSVHMDSEVHLAEGRYDKVIRSYWV